MSKSSVNEDEAKRSEWFEDYVDEEDEVQINEYDITATPNDFNVSTLFNFPTVSESLKISWLLFATAGPAVRTAFTSTRPEVYVQALTGEPGARSADRKWQISTAGGANPLWSGDGKEIFYVALDGTMMSVPVQSSHHSFEGGTPKQLFPTRLVPGGLREYDVTRDGKRFLLNVPMPVRGEEPITVILNWPKLFER